MAVGTTAARGLSRAARVLNGHSTEAPSVPSGDSARGGLDESPKVDQGENGRGARIDGGRMPNVSGGDSSRRLDRPSIRCVGVGGQLPVHSPTQTQEGRGTWTAGVRFSFFFLLHI